MADSMSPIIYSQTTSPLPLLSPAGHRKRRDTGNISVDGSDFDDDDERSSRMSAVSENSRKYAKQNHSEIEKRRRDKMNTYISELSQIVPMCNAMSRKLDKLTVLRMAVQHMKSLRGSIHSYTEGNYKPACLTDQELKCLIYQAAEGFLFVVDCDRGKIMYVSESVMEVLGYAQEDLFGQNWFDILHPKDMAKVKEQLSSSDLSPRERLIDAKTLLPVKADVPQTLPRLCPGARRSFFCRMKSRVFETLKEDPDNSQPPMKRKRIMQGGERKYVVIHCTGYLKSWSPMNTAPKGCEVDSESCNLSCLVAVGRIHPEEYTKDESQLNFSSEFESNEANQKVDQRGNIKLEAASHVTVAPLEFTSRHAMDGKFLFVDQRVCLILGYLPQELLGTSMYEYYHVDDTSHLSESHRSTLATGKSVTKRYRFRTKENNFVYLRTSWKLFKNPWTKDIEYMLATNMYTPMDEGNYEQVSSSRDATNPQQDGSQCIGPDQSISTGVGAVKIGREIANELLDPQRRTSESASPAYHDATQLNNLRSPQINTSISNPRRPSSNTSQSEDGVNHANNNSLPLRMDLLGELPGGGRSDQDMLLAMERVNANSTTSDENEEAAMAVIMSLLEADAGLGGPVDYNGLPWPLP